MTKQLSAKYYLNHNWQLYGKDLKKEQENELPSEGTLTPEEFIDTFSSEQIRIPDFFREYPEFYLNLLDKSLIHLDRLMKSIREDVHNQEYKKAYHSSSYARAMTTNMSLAVLVGKFEGLSDYLSDLYLLNHPQDVNIEDSVNTYLSDVEEEVNRIRKGASMLR